MEYDHKKASGEKILIVDDVELNRLILEEIIKNMGCDPVLAENAKQALEIAVNSRPQLILTDISMPGMDGYELCKTLKSNKKTHDIPVIFISAFDNPQDIVDGFLIGGEDYITKPFVPEIVQARVGVHLRLQEAKIELMAMNRRLQISVSEQLKQMEEEKKNILYALANMAANNFGGYEQGHMERMKRNCRILAQSMQLSPLFEDRISDSYIDTIELAAPVCDIGNIGIPKEILRKEQGMTKEELAAVQSHTAIGAQLLRDLHVNNDYNDFISISIDIAHCHHENWDGSGYPDGLQKNHSRQEALDIMRKDSGIPFNPAIFNIFCKISRQLC